MSACTLTDESFEPSPLDRVEGELNPEGPPERPAHPDDGEAAAPSMTRSDPSGEPSVGSPPLDPGEADDGSGMSAATNSSDGQSTGAPADSGTAPEDGNDGSEVEGAPLPSPVIPCPGREFGTSCYQMFGELVALDVAEQRCVAWGGHLASVESPEEDAFLDDWPAQLEIPFADGSGIWLGGTDAVLDGDFRWWDTSPLGFAGWAPNQPDNGVGVDCIEKRNDGTARWYDRRCTDPRAFACERPR